jgi:hypothetical protein
LVVAGLAKERQEREYDLDRVVPLGMDLGLKSSLNLDLFFFCELTEVN